MDPTQKDAVIGGELQNFLETLVGGARERKETLHFVSAREMANIILAACDGKEGNPGEYRDYRFKRLRDLPAAAAEKSDSLPIAVKTRQSRAPTRIRESQESVRNRPLKSVPTCNSPRSLRGPKSPDGSPTLKKDAATPPPKFAPRRRS